jgi:hypothetical protein
MQARPIQTHSAASILNEAVTMRNFSEIAKIGMFVLACCAVGHSATLPPIGTSYCALTADPASYVGKRVQVRAVYRYSFEVQDLDAPECCPGKRIKIWVEIEPSDAKSKRLFRKFPKAMGLVLATFSGTFETGGPFGNGGRYRLAVDQIEKLEAVGDPAKTSELSWANHDCKISDIEPHLDQPPSLLHETDHVLNPPKQQ